MRSLRSLSFGLVLLLNVLGAAVVARAQAPLQGQFTLPCAVHWEKSTVPAGKYTFSIKAMGASRLLMLQPIERNSRGFFILLHSADEANTGNSELVVVSRGGEWFVSSLRLANMGMALRFAVPEDAHPDGQIARATSPTAQSPAR